MMHLEYKKGDYRGCTIDIQPENSREIPGLRDMLMHNMMIQNPAVYFSKKIKNGGYDGVLKSEVAREAEISSILCDLWDSEASMNVMMLLARAMQMIINLRKNELEICDPVDNAIMDDDIPFN